MVLPTAEQVASVNATAEPWFEPFVALAAFAGLRLGEAAGLQVGDLNFLARSLDVRRQVQRADAGAIEVRAPKYGSERTVFWPTASSRCSLGTSPTTALVETHAGGCSRPLRDHRRTRTPSATNGA